MNYSQNNTPVHVPGKLFSLPIFIGAAAVGLCAGIIETVIDGVSGAISKAADTQEKA